MRPKREIQVVVGIIFNNLGQVLLSTRPEGKSYSGYWEFPGGKIEKNESRIEALHRELHEELNIEVINPTPWLQKKVIYEELSLILFFYRVGYQDWTGDIKALEKQRWCWIDIAKIDPEKILAASISIAKALLIPEQLYIQNNVITDINESFRIVPYDLAKTASQLVYMTFSELIKKRKFINFAWFGVIIENINQMKASIGASLLIWKISSEQSYLDLIKLLTSGQVIPILVTNYSQEQKNKLKELGVHGFIQGNSVITA